MGNCLKNEFLLYNAQITTEDHLHRNSVVMSFLRKVYIKSFQSKSVLSASVLMLCISTSAICAPSGYEKVWEDTFSGGSLDTTNWTIGLRDPGTGHLVPGAHGRYYHNTSYAGYITEEDVWVEGGSLYLQNQQRSYVGTDPVGTYDYTSGFIMSMHKVHFNKGYLECRAKFPSGDKVWPAYWLIAEDLIWGPEWDVFEYFGYRPDRGYDVMLMNLAYGSWPHIYWLGDTIYNYDTIYDCETWHIYGFEWTADYAKFFIDGVKVYQMNNTIGSNWPDEEMYIVLNNGVRTDSPDTNTTWPNYMIVDYIELYQIEIECGDGTCDSGEDQCNCPDDCGTPPSTETSCADGIDNDCDTYTDCDDSDCDGIFPCDSLVDNYSFELPPGGKQIGVVPNYWSVVSADYGIEGFGYDGSQCAFLGGWDSIYYQLTDHTIAQGDDIEISYYGCRTWTFAGRTATFTGNLYYDDNGSRVTLASAPGSASTNGDWVRYTTSVYITPGHVSIGKTLGVELVHTTAASDTWAGFDFVEVVVTGDGDLNLDGRVDNSDVAELAQGWQTSYDMNTLLDVADAWLEGAGEAMNIELNLNNTWMYQNLPTVTSSNLSAHLSIIEDQYNNTSYTCDWEIILPDDVTLPPAIIDGGTANDLFCKLAAPPCDDSNGLSDSGQPFTVKVTVTGDNFDNSGTSEVQFGIALLGDVNNDTYVNVDDRGIINDFWQTGSAGDFTLRDCNINCDGYVNVADRGIVNAIWQGELGQNSVSNPCLPRNDMVLIPGGEFEMGDHFAEGGSNELPLHMVLLDTFFMSKFEITNSQYCDYLNSALDSGSIYLSSDVVYGTGNNQGYCDTSASSSYSQIVYSGGVFIVGTKGSRDMSNDPIVQASWYGAVAYCNWRSSEEGYQACHNLSTWECDFSKHGYRLPTEAEWEYAARGGEHSPYYRFPWGDTINHDYANYAANSSAYSYDTSPYTTDTYHPDWNDGIEPYTSVVGSFSANGYGLYDMVGNVYEWCNDWYDSNYYNVSPYDNPEGPASGTFRVPRGGRWHYDAIGCRVARRGYGNPDVRGAGVGFRIVLDLN